MRGNPELPLSTPSPSRGENLNGFNLDDLTEAGNTQDEIATQFAPEAPESRFSFQRGVGAVGEFGLQSGTIYEISKLTDRTPLKQAHYNFGSKNSNETLDAKPVFDVGTGATLTTGLFTGSLKAGARGGAAGVLAVAADEVTEVAGKKVYDTLVGSDTRKKRDVRDYVFGGLGGLLAGAAMLTAGVFFAPETGGGSLVAAIEGVAAEAAGVETVGGALTSTTGMATMGTTTALNVAAVGYGRDQGKRARNAFLRDQKKQGVNTFTPGYSFVDPSKSAPLPPGFENAGPIHYMDEDPFFDDDYRDNRIKTQAARREYTKIDASTLPPLPPGFNNAGPAHFMDEDPLFNDDYMQSRIDSHIQAGQ